MADGKKRGRPASGRNGVTTTVYFARKYLSLLALAKRILGRSKTEIVEEALDDYFAKHGITLPSPSNPSDSG